nr:hypothetical protein [uncultured Parasutterella sp.]
MFHQLRYANPIPVKGRFIIGREGFAAHIFQSLNIGSVPSRDECACCPEVRLRLLVCDHRRNVTGTKPQHSIEKSGTCVEEIDLPLFNRILQIGGAVDLRNNFPRREDFLKMLQTRRKVHIVAKGRGEMYQTNSDRLLRRLGEADDGNQE